MSAVVPFSTWYHPKTDSTYTVIGIAECSTNGSEGQRVVVYLSHSRQVLKYRDYREFTDGRFVPGGRP